MERFTRPARVRPLKETTPKIEGVAADTDTIATDRPDVVESSLTVGKWRFQIETSVGVEHDHSGSIS
jgi:hypothetical protein